jgi:NitT/TauT family transport system permease protein
MKTTSPDMQSPAAEYALRSRADEDAMIAAGAAVTTFNTHHIHLLSVASFIALWVLLSLTLPADVLPGPLPVLSALWDNVVSGDLFYNVYRTLTRVFLSFALAMLVGVPIGVAMGLNRRIEAASVIWVIVLLTVPGLVYLILMFMWFGLNELSTVLAITITGLPSVIIVIWEGVKNIDNKLTAMARAFGVPHVRRVRGVLLPQLMPYLFSATRFGLGVMWKITVFAELLGRSDGVGFKLNYWYQLYNMKQVLAWTLAFTIVMIVLELGIIRQLERRLFVWRPVAKL